MPPKKLYTPMSIRRFQGSAPGGDLDAIMASIKSLESKGNYQAMGKQTKSGDRAYGAYQVMGANIPSWTKEALGHELTPDEFLQDREAQDTVARYFMGKSFAKYGNPDDVASVWFTGRPYAQAGGTVADVTGTSNDEYINIFREGLGKLGAGLNGAKKYIPLSQRYDASGQMTLQDKPGWQDILNLPDTLAGLPGKVAGAATDFVAGTKTDIPGMFSEQVGQATEEITDSPGLGMVASVGASFAVPGGPAGKGGKYIPKALRGGVSAEKGVVNTPADIQGIKQVVENAQKYDPEFRHTVDDIAAEGGWQVAHGPVKQADRIEEKLKADGKTVADLRDANRSTIIVSGKEDLDDVVKLIERNFGEIVRIKDKFDSPKESYRSAIINVRTPTGGQAEIAVTTPEQWEAKTALGGQELYKQVRVKKEGWEEAYNEMKKLYNDAYLSSLNRR